MDSKNKKQWSKDDCSNLIELYRQHTHLWNSKSMDYKNRNKRQDSLQEIGNIFNCSGDEIDRKIKNLISQYNRERRKYKSMKKSGAGQHFVSKWFGYNAMSFLHDKNKPRKGSQSGLNVESMDSDSSSNSSSNDTQSTTHDNDTQSTTYDTESYDENLDENGGNMSQALSETSDVPSSSRDGQSSVEKGDHLFTTPKVIAKKTKQSATNIRQEAFNMMKSVYDSRKTQPRLTGDEYEVFGELVGRKVRSLKTKYAKATVEHLINNILYNAELGKYDAPTLTYYTTTSTPSSSPSPSSLHPNTSLDSNTNNETIMSEQHVNNLLNGSHSQVRVPQHVGEDSLMWAVNTSFGLNQ